MKYVYFVLALAVAVSGCAKGSGDGSAGGSGGGSSVSIPQNVNAPAQIEQVIQGSNQKPDTFMKLAAAAMDLLIPSAEAANANLNPIIPVVPVNPVANYYLINIYDSLIANLGQNVFDKLIIDLKKNASVFGNKTFNVDFVNPNTNIASKLTFKFVDLLIGNRALVDDSGKVTQIKGFFGAKSFDVVKNSSGKFIFSGGFVSANASLLNRDIAILDPATGILTVQQGIVTTSLVGNGKKFVSNLVTAGLKAYLMTLGSNAQKMSGPNLNPYANVTAGVDFLVAERTISTAQSGPNLIQTATSSKIGILNLVSNTVTYLPVDAGLLAAISDLPEFQTVVTNLGSSALAQ